MNTPRITLAAAVVRAKAEILRDIDEGRVPDDASSFAVLHDYVDANEYGGLCENVYDALRGDGDDPEDAWVDFGNRLQDEIDAWLRKGRPGVRTVTFSLITDAEANDPRLLETVAAAFAQFEDDENGQIDFTSVRVD